MPEPLKRVRQLQDFSREHHQILVFTLRLRKGLQKGVDTKQLGAYCLWFYNNFLRNHIYMEEKLLYSILDENDPLREKGLRQHKIIVDLIQTEQKTRRNIQEIQQKLTTHIRFEERNFFETIQKTASEKQLKNVENSYNQSQLPVCEFNFWG